MAFDKSQFLDGFKAEVREHLQQISMKLLKLEKIPGDKQLLEVLMREAHTIKGAARMMGYKRISEIAHKTEDAFEEVMQEKVQLKKKHFDLLLKCVDAIESLLSDKVTWDSKGVNFPYVENLCRQLDKNFLKKTSKKATKNKPTRPVEHPADGLDTIQEKRPKDQTAVESEEKFSEASESNVSSLLEESVRVGVDKLDHLMNISGELFIARIRLNDLTKHLEDLHEVEASDDQVLSGLYQSFSAINESINYLTSNLKEEVMNLRMVPVMQLFQIFPRAMRDLAHEKGKSIDLKMEGVDTQLDKAIIDEMRDPLMHILRNAIDHGIEPEEERLRADKPEMATIKLKASQQGAHVVIEISDDGCGIDIEGVKKRALENGLVSPERLNEMSNDQAYQFIFSPGFTTNDNVTDVSGRGVGLDVVREKVSQFKGLVEVDSSPGLGTTFILRLPLTVAITESLLVVAGEDTFAIPSDMVVETVRMSSDEIRSVEGKEAISVRGYILPLIKLNNLFGLPTRGIIEKRFFPVIIIQSVERKIAIWVDEILGRQEIVQKNLGDPLQNIPNISGATILADGRVILILDIASIIESAESGFAVRKDLPASHRSPAASKKTILLADDVLSTAMLQKNILESVGYDVVIARDGQEAYQKAEQEKFDLVITDILMPRMNGFVLTEKLKSNPDYQNVPVIIVTTREKEEDKKRGMDAGADAYIIKSDFTSDVLLDTIERLLG